MVVNDIMKAVEARLLETFPDEPVYWDRLPNGFKRPSTSLECQRDTVTDINYGLVRHEAELLITCFSAVNEPYHDSSRADLNVRLDRVLCIFHTGYLVLDDRHITVSDHSGVGTPEYSEVAVRVTWIDVRPGLGESGVTAENYHLNINGKD